VSPRWLYNLLYCGGAPWELGPRSELVRLVTSGLLSPRRLFPGRAIDLGCGSGADSVFLAEHGFDVTGVDYSWVAIGKARRRAASSAAADRVRFVLGDLTEQTLSGVRGPFDLLVDCCTIDDVRHSRRLAMAETVKRLSRPGSAFFLWCFYDVSEQLPALSTRGPSRLHPEGLTDGEERNLFGDVFQVGRLPAPAKGSGAAAFLMWRKNRYSRERGG